MDPGLKGKCALVTGGSKGIGLANSQRCLPMKGANVAICARNADDVGGESSELRAFRSSGDCTESKDDHGQDDDREAPEHGITVRADQHLSATKNQSSEC